MGFLYMVMLVLFGHHNMDRDIRDAQSRLI